MRTFVIGALAVAAGCVSQGSLLTTTDGGRDGAPVAGAAGAGAAAGHGGGPVAGTTGGGTAGAGKGGGGPGAAGASGTTGVAGGGAGGSVAGAAGGGRGGIAGTFTARGGTGGGLAGTGGMVQPPPSTGEFRYPGRWWGRLTAADRAAAFVIHWSATDPTDRGLWTRSQIYGLNVTPGPEDGVTMMSSAPEMKGCWTLYATADPDELRVQPCDTPPSSGQAAIGFFRRGARLINPVPLPPVGGAPTNRVYASRFGGAGQWIATSVDDRLSLWKNDVGQAFELGQGISSYLDFSPDGRRVVYVRSLNGKGALIAYDTAAAGERQVTADGAGSGTGLVYFTGVFSRDGRRFAYFDQPNFGSTSADLAVYDFDTDQALTVASRITPGFLPGDAMFLGGSSRLVYRAYDATMPISTETIPFHGYDFATDTARSLGDAVELTAIPGGDSVAYRTYAGDVRLIDGATFTSRLLGTTSPGPGLTGGYAGFAPAADGKRLAFLDLYGQLHVVSFDGRPELILDDDGGCLPDYGSREGPHDQLPNPPRAALFTPDGGAIIHAVASYCDRSPSVLALARYDLVTGRETVQPLASDFVDVYALSPLGQIAYQGGGAPPRLLSWPGPFVELERSGGGVSSGDPLFSFTSDGRFLNYAIDGFLMFRDIAAGTTRRLAPIAVQPVPWVASQETGVAVVSDAGGATAYLPDGSSLSLDGASITMSDPRGTIIAYGIRDLAGDGTTFFRLQPGATPRLVGNGYPLAVSATQVIFRDLDGVCSFSL